MYLTKRITSITDWKALEDLAQRDHNGTNRLSEAISKITVSRFTPSNLLKSWQGKYILNCAVVFSKKGA